MTEQAYEVLQSLDSHGSSTSGQAKVAATANLSGRTVENVRAACILFEVHNALW